MLRLSVALALMLATAASAQSYKVLRSFGVSTNLIDVSGYSPEATLVQGPDGTLYGTTANGLPPVAGTVFRLNSDGTGFHVLKWFTNSVEGGGPYGGLVLSGGMLFGTTPYGGLSNWGVVFKVSTDGSGYTVLKNFTGSVGGLPNGDLVLAGNTLYGTTYSGGSSDSGVVFKVNTDGSDYAVLKSFTGSDGVFPTGGLVLAGSMLYGTTGGGGSSDQGVVFKLNTNGSGYAVLKSFVGGSDGGIPNGGLVLGGNALYGTMASGGTWGDGVVFKVDTDGSGYAVLKNFTRYNGDGWEPYAGLVLAGSTLYGTTGVGGTSNLGVVFKVNTDGSNYAVLKNFTGTDGSEPGAALFLAGSMLYGTTYSGGGSDSGVVFKVNTDGADYAVLKSFIKSFVGSDGMNPRAGLILASNTLYGTTHAGGDSNYGTVFRVNTDGSGYAVLKSFTGSDGVWPSASLTSAGNTLCGTTYSGGNSNYGVVFKLNTDGSGYAVLKSFSGFDGMNPNAGPVLAGSTLYGTTVEGGYWYGYYVNPQPGGPPIFYPGDGVVFKVNTDGSGYAVLKSFSGNRNPCCLDVSHPSASLVLAGSTLYGTTQSGGISNRGAVFKVNTDGSGYVVLKNFTGSDGSGPIGRLVLAGSTLYGTADGGSSGYGVVFKLNTDGSGYALLKNFTGSDGIEPHGSLILSGSTLYGTAGGGSSGYGVVFKLNTDGSGFAVLKSFTGSDGAWVQEGLVLAGCTLYGTTEGGGDFGLGVVFSLSLSPQLALVPSAGNVILTWPTNATGFTLQSTTNLGSSAVWTSSSPAPVVVNGQNTVTTPISGTQQFYRLSQ